MYARTTWHENVQMWLLLRCRLIEGAHLTAVQRMPPLQLQQPLVTAVHLQMPRRLLSHHSTTLLPISSRQHHLQTRSSLHPGSSRRSLPCRGCRPLQVRS